MEKVLFIYGTRPEAIKMAPLVKQLGKNDNLDVAVCLTGQHREMVDSINDTFDINADFDLNVFTPGQSLNRLSASVIAKLNDVLEINRPDVVVVQGDTTSAFCGAYAGFLFGARIVHLEAGLRSGQIRDPFPEEANRKLIGQITDLHLAPTENAAKNLQREYVDPSQIYISGNTVIDALFVAVNSLRNKEQIEPGRRILLTIHRRENLESGLFEILEAVVNLANSYPDITIEFPMHPNPKIREQVIPALREIPNVKLMEPLNYLDLIEKIRSSYLVLTDSGGLQEEAPALGKPVLVLRKTTERPEGIVNGTARLVGTNSREIFEEVSKLLDSNDKYLEMAGATNPYGDGNAAIRAESAILELLGLGKRLPEFR